MSRASHERHALFMSSFQLRKAVPDSDRTVTRRGLAF